MLRSMTGYGRSERTINEKNFIIEIRSLNGKQFELLLKLPVQLKPYEFEIRSLLAEKLIRGSVECTVSIKQNGASKPSSINLDLAASYYQQLKTLADQLNADDSQLLSSILRLPEVVANSTDVVAETEWDVFKAALQDAITMINKHRMDEGAVLEQELLGRISNIEKSQQKVLELDPARKVKIRESILKLLDEQVGKENVDMNRFEQELIYYIEKIDLTEEQVRLTNHCNYFRTLLQEEEISKGRKLSFLLQEIGREINTTGSKAYDATIQKAVVEMKDELEKAKEQVLNIL
ncbi:MAG: YicC/YloC family endoribonuclease [Chitinophagaceae bacterium]|jgi:uncharacterized protein (TIGR00255 family)